MRWAAKKRIRIARAATCWLIRRFLDPAAELVFTDEDEVLRLEREAGALGFHVKGARYPPVDDRGRIPFERRGRAAPRRPGARAIRPNRA